MKLSGAYRTSGVGHPYPDVQVFVDALLRALPSGGAHIGAGAALLAPQPGDPGAAAGQRARQRVLRPGRERRRPRAHVDALVELGAGELLDEAEGLLDRLAVETSPSGGWHVVYRSAVPVRRASSVDVAAPSAR